MRRLLVVPTALVGLLAFAPTVNAAFGLLRPEVAFEAKDGRAARSTGGTSATPPPATGGVSPLPSGGIGPDGFEGPGRCRRGSHEVRRKGRVRCVRDKQTGTGGVEAGKSGRAGR